MPDTRTIGWLLDEADRAALLACFPPVWPDVIAHHVTLQSATDHPLPTETSGEIVALANARQSSARSSLGRSSPPRIRTRAAPPGRAGGFAPFPIELERSLGSLRPTIGS